METKSRWLLIFGIATIGMFAKTVAQTSPSLDDLINILTNWYKEGEQCKDLPEDFLTTNELITTNGFGFEEYTVTTEDGYILKLHRIISNNTGGFPILIQHGFLVASDFFLVQPTNISLAFLLALAGFDVWLPDLRGDCYSREHVSLKPTDPKFWQFSFHESGIYDLPAFIDHILYVTGYSQLFYIGHSMGTTVFLVMASIRPEYNQKIKTAILLAPIAYVPPVQELESAIVKTLTSQIDNIYTALKSIGMYELVPRTAAKIQALSSLCGNGLTQDLCFDFLGMIYGDDRQNLDKRLFPQQITYFPAGTSLNTAHHLLGLYKNGGDFRLYDNCTSGQNGKPAYYPLNKVTVPVYMYYPLNDHLSNERSVMKTAQNLPNVKKVEAVSNPKFAHLDFLLGKNVYEVLNGALVSLLKSLAGTGQ